jgi:hypothetical protein
MNGPYDYVPPNYWYDKAHSDLGGAWSFNSETSAGPDIPTMDTLKRMMSASELDTMWKSPSTAQYHRSSSSTFANLKLFGDALTGRYGKPSSLADFVRKAQLAQYENIRAEFESHSRNFSDSSNPATGIIYWMLVLRGQEGERAAAHPVLVRHEVGRGGQPQPRRGVGPHRVREAVQPRRDGEVQPVQGRFRGR